MDMIMRTTKPSSRSCYHWSSIAEIQASLSVMQQETLIQKVSIQKLSGFMLDLMFSKLELVVIYLMKLRPYSVTA